MISFLSFYVLIWDLDLEHCASGRFGDLDDRTGPGEL